MEAQATQRSQGKGVQRLGREGFGLEGTDRAAASAEDSSGGCNEDMGEGVVVGQRGGGAIDLKKLLPTAKDSSRAFLPRGIGGGAHLLVVGPKW